MKHKPGDIIVWKDCYKRVCLILEVDQKSRTCQIFVLNHPNKIKLYERSHLSFDSVCFYYFLLKGKKLK